MKKSNGFGLAYVLITIVLIAAAGIGFYVYNRDNDKSINNINTTNKQQGARNNNEQAADPYEGWVTGNLKYEKADFKYPSDWDLSNKATATGITGNISPGSDQVTIVSPTDITVTIKTGVFGIGDGFSNVLSSEAITTLDSSYHLNFYTNNSANRSKAQGACVGTTPTDKANYPFSRNIQVMNNDEKPFNVVCINYPEDDNGDVPERLVGAFKNDGSFREAQLIIESLSY
jgi:hypothetical protein